MCVSKSSGMQPSGASSCRISNRGKHQVMNEDVSSHMLRVEWEGATYKYLPDRPHSHFLAPHAAGSHLLFGRVPFHFWRIMAALTSNATFSCFVFYAVLLVMKMYIIAIITGQVRLRRKVSGSYGTRKSSFINRVWELH